VAQILTPGASVSLGEFQTAAVRNLHTVETSTVTVSGFGGALSVTNATRSSRLLGNLTVADGATFRAGGTTTVNGTFRTETNQGGGVNLRGIDQSGTLVVGPSGTLLLAAPTTTIGDGFTLSNQSTTGTSAIAGANVYFNGGPGYIVNAGTLKLQSGGVLNQGGSGSVTNTGLLVAEPTTGETVFFDTTLVNAEGARLEVVAGGTLRIGFEDAFTSRPGSLHQLGTIQIGSGAVLELRSGLNNEPSSMLQAGSTISGDGLLRVLRGYTGVFGQASASNVELTGGRAAARSTCPACSRPPERGLTCAARDRAAGWSCPRRAR
jgi:hypothetical protein